MGCNGWFELPKVPTDATEKSVAQKTELSSPAPLPFPFQDTSANAATNDTHKVVASYQHVAALRPDGLFLWGKNDLGQIGKGNATPVESLPIRLMEIDGPWKDVALGLDHSCALSSGGNLYCWGSNAKGAVGVVISSPLGNDSFPSPVLALSNVKAIVAEGFYTCAIKLDSSLWCWGSRGTIQNNTPVQLKISVPTFVANQVAQVVGESDTICYITFGGALRCFGYNPEQMLGADLPPELTSQVELIPSGVLDANFAFDRLCYRTLTQVWCTGRTLGDRAEDHPSHLARVFGAYTTAFYQSGFWTLGDQIRKITANGAALTTSDEFRYGSFYHYSFLENGLVIALGVHDIDFSPNEIVNCFMFKTGNVRCWGSNRFGQMGSGKVEQKDYLIRDVATVVFP